MDINFKFNIGDHIFVLVDNALLYKTKVKDIRVIVDETRQRIRPFIIECEVLDTSKDSPVYRWVEQDKCISIFDYRNTIKLDADIDIQSKKM